MQVPASTCSYGDEPRLWVDDSAAIGQEKLDERFLDGVFDVIVPG